MSYSSIMDFTGMQTNDLGDSERTIKRSLDQDRWSPWIMVWRRIYLWWANNLCFSAFLTFSFSFFSPWYWPLWIILFWPFLASEHTSLFFTFLAGNQLHWSMPLVMLMIGLHDITSQCVHIYWNGTEMVRFENGSDDDDSLELLCGQVETKCAAFLIGYRIPWTFGDENLIDYAL